jgi:hypothetical protein
MRSYGTALLLTLKPLEFWPMQVSQLPIFGRFARQFQSVGSTECSCEEFFFFVRERICIDLRDSLSRDHIDELYCEYHWKRLEMDLNDVRR